MVLLRSSRSSRAFTMIHLLLKEDGGENTFLAGDGNCVLGKSSSFEGDF